MTESVPILKKSEVSVDETEISFTYGGMWLVRVISTFIKEPCDLVAVKWSFSQELNNGWERNQFSKWRHVIGEINFEWGESHDWSVSWCQANQDWNVIVFYPINSSQHNSFRTWPPWGTETIIPMGNMCVHRQITIFRVPPQRAHYVVPPGVATQLLGSGGTALQLSQRYCKGTL